MPRWYVTLERRDRAPLYVSVFIEAVAQNEAIALAVASAERRRGALRPGARDDRGADHERGGAGLMHERRTAPTAVRRPSLPERRV